MASVLKNTTTTDKYADTVLGGDGIYDHGALLVANNPVSLLVLTGVDRGAPTPIEYPYVTPTLLPLVRGERDFIVGVQVKSAIIGIPAQVSGYLLEPGAAGPAVGSAFSSTVSAGGTVTVGAPVLTGYIDGATGNVNAGTGFTCARTGVGVYVITFSPAFSGTPYLIPTPVGVGQAAEHGAITASGTTVRTFTTTTGALLDNDFQFVAGLIA